MKATEVRVRFPPSPTGFLHVGGARTALFNFLFAKAHQGKFLLRIEDTDRARSEDRFTDDIMASLKWLGLEWDEEPVYQSKRIERHREVAEDLIRQGLAYRCDCTPETLDAYRKECQKKKVPYRYPETCREKTTVGDKYVVRLKVPHEGETTFEDLIRGPITIPHKDIEDWVVARSDGNPTYNFVVVVDDHEMGVTHVLRGEDHINNTPKQALLYQALGYPLPKFGHLPMILGQDKAKLSKRHGAASTLEYRKIGYLPEVMVNFLVRLGWSYGDQEIFSMEELKQKFSLENVGKSNAIFNTEKLDWISGVHLREKPTAELCAYMRQNFAEELKFTEGVEASRFEAGVACIQGKVKLIPELIEQLHCLFGEDPSLDAGKLKDAEKQLAKTYLPDLLSLFEGHDFSVEGLEKDVKALVETKGDKFGKVGKIIRFALTGGRISPGLFEMISVQGKETVLRRLKSLEKALG